MSRPLPTVGLICQGRGIPRVRHQLDQVARFRVAQGSDESQGVSGPDLQGRTVAAGFGTRPAASYMLGTGCGVHVALLRLEDLACWSEEVLKHFMLT